MCLCFRCLGVQDLDAKTQAEIDREVEALMKQMGDQSADWQRNLNALGESVHGTYRPWMSELEAAVRAEIERLKARGQGVSAKELERRLAELRAKLESLSAGGEAVRFPAGLSLGMLVVFCFSCPSCRPLGGQRCLNRGVGFACGGPGLGGVPLHRVRPRAARQQHVEPAAAAALRWPQGAHRE